MKIYLAKSNSSNPNTLINTREEIKKHGEVVEFLGGDWRDHEPLIKTCDLMVIISHPQNINGSACIGRGLYTTLATFTEGFSDKWKGSVIYAVTDPVTDKIAFLKVTSCEIYNTNNWKMEYGRLKLENIEHDFRYFTEESLKTHEGEIYHDETADLG